MLVVLAFISLSGACLGVRAGRAAERDADKLHLDADSFVEGGHCGYNQSDILNETELSTDHRTIWDPRTTIGNSGWKMGLAAKIISLSRVFVYRRVFPVTLIGSDAGVIAQRMVQAMYGLEQIRIPTNCWAKMTEAFNNEQLGLEDFKRKKKQWKDLIKHWVPRECPDVEDYKTVEKTAEGKLAYRQLWVLLRGYWSLYPDLTDEARSMLGFRYIDELRIVKQDWSLRQVFHYFKMHLVNHQEHIVRDKLLGALSKTDRKTWQSTMRAILRMQNLRNVRLSRIELDGFGNCVSSQPHSPDNMLQALTGADVSRIQVTLFFRESLWPHLGKSIKGVFTHPLVSFRKKQERMADTWVRTTPGYRFKTFVLQPILFLTNVAGFMLGVLTGGQATLVSLMLDLFFDAGVASLVTAATPMAFWLGEIFSGARSSFQEATKEYMITHAETLKVTQKFLNLLTDDNKFMAISRTKDMLDAEVDKIMSSPSLLEAMVNFDRETAAGADGGDIDMEEDTRKYVEGLIYHGFIKELTPLLDEELEARRSRADPSYGWLRWEDWRRFREGGFDSDARKLLGMQIRVEQSERGMLEDIGESGWDGSEINVTTAHRKMLPWQSRHLEATTKDGSKLEIDLSKFLKSRLYVKDTVAYRKSLADYLLYHEWSEYRRGDSGRALAGKDIMFDASLYGCQKVMEQSGCGLSLGLLIEPDRHTVITTEVTFGVYDRQVWVKVQGVLIYFVLTPAVKSCLKVKDPDAYQKYEADADRREDRLKYSTGEIKATDKTIFKDVVEAMQNKMSEDGIAKDVAQAGNSVLRHKLGLESLELEMTAKSSSTEEKAQRRGITRGIGASDFDAPPPEDGEEDDDDDDDDDEELADTLQAVLEGFSTAKAEDIA